MGVRGGGGGGGGHFDSLGDLIFLETPNKRLSVCMCVVMYLTYHLI